MARTADLTQPLKPRRTSDDTDLPMPKVPGPTGSSGANLLIVDTLTRLGAVALRIGLQRTFLRSTLGKHDVAIIAKKRSLPQKAASIALSRIAIASLPAAVLVGTGLLAVTVYQRRRDERFRRAQGKMHLLGKGDGKGEG